MKIMEISKQSPNNVVREIALLCLTVLFMIIVTYFLTVWSR